MGGFYFENLRLRSNVTIRGGLLQEKWNRNPFRRNTTIVGAPGQPAVLGMGVENVSLKDLVIRSADAVLNTRTDTLSTFQLASYTGPNSVAISLYEMAARRAPAAGILHVPFTRAAPRPAARPVAQPHRKL